MKSNITNLIYIDTVEAYTLIPNDFDNITDLLITDNPLLANNPNIKKNIFDVTKLLSQEKNIEIGGIALDLCNDIENIIIKKKYSSIFKYHPGKFALFMVLRSLLISTITKSLMMAYILQKISVKNIKIIIAKSNEIDNNKPWNIPRFSNVFKILSDFGFFGNVPVSYSFVDVAEPINYNDTRDKNFLLRLIVWPPSVIIHHLLKFFNKFLPNKKAIYMLKECETLRETLPWLQLKGYKIKKINLPIINNIDKSNNIIVDEMDANIGILINKYLSKYFNKSQVQAQKFLFIKHINLWLNCIKEDEKKLDLFFKNQFIKGDFIISSGIYGPLANQIFFLCKKYNINLIGFQHGLAAGINYSNNRYKIFLESTTCDFFLACSDGAKNIFECANSSSKISKNNSVVVMGEADQKKNIYFRSIQKYFSRRRFNLSYGENIVMHVSGLGYGGNNPNAIDGPSESYMFDKEKLLLEKVYNNINKKVIYKSYPSQRLLYQPSYSELKKISSNIIMVGNEDFRYVRTAADIIVTDSSYSTLSWCLMDNVPIVFLKSRLCSRLISKEVEEYFNESFLVIDSDDLNWEYKLINLLNLPKTSLYSLWNAKKTKRKFLVEKYLCGPAGNSGLRAANFIDKYIGNYNDKI